MSLGYRSEKKRITIQRKMSREKARKGSFLG